MHSRTSLGPLDHGVPQQGHDPSVPKCAPSRPKCSPSPPRSLRLGQHLAILNPTIPGPANLFTVTLRRAPLNDTEDILFSPMETASPRSGIPDRGIAALRVQRPCSPGRVGPRGCFLNGQHLACGGHVLELARRAAIGMDPERGWFMATVEIDWKGLAAG